MEILFLILQVISLLIWPIIYSFIESNRIIQIGQRDAVIEHLNTECTMLKNENAILKIKRETGADNN